MFSKQQKFGQWSGQERAPGSLPLLMMPGLSGARLTATPGTAVTTSDVTAGTTLSLTEHTSDRVMLMSEWGEWRAVRLPRTPAGVAERTYSFLADSPWALANATAYDIFAFIGADGFVDIERGPAWSSATARAAALARLDGAYVLGINPTRLWVGSIYASAANQIADSFGGAHQAGGKRFVWNMYNRVLRHLGVIDTTDSWTYTTATWRQANGATGNKVEIMLGLSLEIVKAEAQACVRSTSAATNTGVGIDSSTVNSALTGGSISGATAGTEDYCGIYKGYPGIGYHDLRWLEISQASGTTTWRGDSAVSYFQQGLQAEVWA